MPRRRSPEPFFLILKDDEKQLFAVIGPMTDDTSWTHRVYEAQQRGCHVRCETVRRANIESARAGFAQAFPGWRYVSDPSGIIHD